MFVRVGRWVDFFFVLSGFVIAHVALESLAADRRGATAFMIRRIGRIWPLHVVILGAYAVYELAVLAANRAGLLQDPQAFTDRMSPHLLPSNILMIQSWGPSDKTSWNGPAWSISAEFAAYLIFAGVLVVLGRKGRLLLIAIGIGSAAVMVATSPIGMASDAYLPVLRCLYGFCTGVAMWMIWQRRPERKLPFANILEPVLLVTAFGLVSLIPSDLSYIIVPIFAFAIFVFAHEQGFVSRALLGKVGQALGMRSYSIYMVHGFVVTVIFSIVAMSGRFGLDGLRLGPIAKSDTQGLIGPFWIVDTIHLIYLLFIIALSALTYRFIEAPARNIAARWASRVTQQNSVRHVPPLT